MAKAIKISKELRKAAELVIYIADHYSAYASNLCYTTSLCKAIAERWIGSLTEEGLDVIQEGLTPEFERLCEMQGKKEEYHKAKLAVIYSFPIV